MEWYKVLGLILVGLFCIATVITDGFDFLNKDNDDSSGGMHP
jgi:hypothetical protein